MGFLLSRKAWVLFGNRDLLKMVPVLQAFYGINFFAASKAKKFRVFELGFQGSPDCFLIWNQA